MDGNVAGYQFRLLAGTPMSPTNFDRGFAPVLRPLPAAGPAGQIVSFQVGELLPDVQYSLGVRAEDDCANLSELVVIPFRTGSTAYGTVPPCGCSGAGPVAELPVALGLFWALSLIRRSRRRR